MKRGLSKARGEINDPYDREVARILIDEKMPLFFPMASSEWRYAARRRWDSHMRNRGLKLHIMAGKHQGNDGAFLWIDWESKNG